MLIFALIFMKFGRYLLADDKKSHLKHVLCACMHDSRCITFKVLHICPGLFYFLVWTESFVNKG